jgi:hypothetical protein
MSLMRHTDIRLTANVYNEPTLMNLDDEVSKLPRLIGGPDKTD